MDGDHLQGSGLARAVQPQVVAPDLVVGPAAADFSGAGVGSASFDIMLLTNSSGTFSFQGAQNVSNAGNATMRAGSYLEYTAV
jgi:hypothetical protein